MSKIEWTETTWNPVTGCTRISEGCERCYIERTPPMRMAHRRFDGPDIGATTGVQLHPDRLGKPLSWRKPRRIFVCSMADLFHDDIPDGYIARVWEVMAQAPQHTYQILTKRPARMRSWLKRWHDNTGDETVKGSPLPYGPEAVRAVYNSPRARLFADMLENMGEPPPGAAYPLYDWMEGPRRFPGVLPHVWIGTSVESQKWADIRIPQLLDTPAAVRWISAEPLLGPVDLSKWLDPSPTCGCGIPLDGAPDAAGCCASCMESEPPPLDWVVGGGETGPGARPLHPDWLRSLRDQCQGAGVPFFLKQFGDWGTRTSHGWPMNDVWTHPDRHCWVDPETGGTKPYGEFTGAEDSGYALMHRVGKQLAGRFLDGRTWDEFPEVTA